ncbi:hypothetical protein [Jiangella ureilytica]|uniref:hypothetical protein n=1 Tax=Jiangella ureilytica TaxID=2530374 RepID=UPI00193CB0FA
MGISQSTASHHVRKLTDARFVHAGEGRHHHPRPPARPWQSSTNCYGIVTRRLQSDPQVEAPAVAFGEVLSPAATRCPGILLADYSQTAICLRWRGPQGLLTWVGDTGIEPVTSSV